MSVNQKDIIVTHGPSLYAPFQAIIIDYDQSTLGGDNKLSSEHIQKLSKILPDIITSKLSMTGINDVNKLLEKLIAALHDAREPLELKLEIQEAGNKQYRLITEYYNERTTRWVLQLSFNVISFIKSPELNSLEQLLKHSQQIVRSIINNSPGYMVQGIMLVAKKRGIPLYLVEYDTHLTSFGQGVKSVIFENSSNEFDSKIGYLLQENKVRTSNFLKKVGYPATNQMVVHSFDMCLKSAESLGYPVVIKPISGGLGRGVTANIHTPKQLKYAYDEAVKKSTKTVLIEKHVNGDVYRITMANNKIIGLGHRHLPQVIGDGKNTIRVLINQENVRRQQPGMIAKLIIPITIDSRLISNLQNVNYGLDSIPNVGEKVMLGDIHNRSVGATQTMRELGDMHPDYIDMVHDLAKLFRLDSIGIDIMSPDISLSWREVGVIIEMNAHPGPAPALLDKMMGDFFSNNKGRIDTTLVVTSNHNFSELIFNKKQEKYSKAGLANNQTAAFKTGPLMVAEQGLFNNCLALLLNNSCDAIVVSITPDEIIKSGLPIDYFDHCIIDPESNTDGELINSSVQTLTDDENLTNWLSRYTGRIDINNSEL